jgi:hypothetical protein
MVFSRGIALKLILPRGSVVASCKHDEFYASIFIKRRISSWSLFLRETWTRSTVSRFRNASTSTFYPPPTKFDPQAAWNMTQHSPPASCSSR